MSGLFAASEESLVKKVEALLILLSPFFFWGTSMVAMKVSLYFIFQQGVVKNLPFLTRVLIWGRLFPPTQLLSLSAQSDCCLLA